MEIPTTLLLHPTKNILHFRDGVIGELFTSDTERTLQGTLTFPEKVHGVDGKVAIGQR